MVMNIKKIYIYISLAAVSLGFSSCDDYLDKLPDNRMELNSKERCRNSLFLHILNAMPRCSQKCILTTQMPSK